MRAPTIYCAGYRWNLRFLWYMRREKPFFGTCAGYDYRMRYRVWWFGPFELWRCNLSSE